MQRVDQQDRTRRDRRRRVRKILHQKHVTQHVAHHQHLAQHRQKGVEEQEMQRVDDVHDRENSAEHAGVEVAARNHAQHECQEGEGGADGIATAPPTFCIEW